MSIPRCLPTRRRLQLLLIGGAVLISLLLPLRIRFFLSLVEGESMVPSLRPGRVMLIDKFAYRNADPSREDIVIARYQEHLLVKRVVGLPGEEVEVNFESLWFARVSQHKAGRIQSVLSVENLPPFPFR